jgi:selenocysteine-specific elongation factor
VIIATAGHIDHGKTSLVKAITGIDADRLKEEKARGITIDLGFAYWPQTDGSSIGFVDVPGHDGYVHNMLAGVTGAAGLLLVVAANEGARPQTLEHLLIAGLLGMTAGVVALSKADLADTDQRAQRVGEIRAVLAATAMRDAPVIFVSAVTGEGIPELAAALRDMAGRALAETGPHPFRLAVDRVFSLHGAGTVVTGGVKGIEVRTGDRLLLSPSGREVRVRGLHAQNIPADAAFAGQRAAVNLAGAGVGDIRRGDVLLAPELHRPTQRLDALLTLAPAESRALATWTPVHVHAGTGSWTGRVVPLRHAAIQSGAAEPVQIVLDAPAALLGGDRFVLRDASARRTIGGGVVLDRAGPERNRRKPERLAALDLIARQGPTAAWPGLLALPPHAIALEAFAADHGLSPEAFHAVIARENLLVLPGIAGKMVLAPALVLTLSRQIRERLAEHHRQLPDQSGLSADRLRLALPERLTAAAFAALTAHLIRRGEIAANGAFLRLPDHVPRLSAQHEALWASVEPLLSGEERFKPPRVNALAEALQQREDTVRGLLKRLARRGDVDEVAEDHFLLRSAVIELLESAKETQRTQPEGWFNAAAFRDRIGIGRKMAILILEFFDRHGVTVRKGDMRRVDARRAGMFNPP